MLRLILLLLLSATLVGLSACRIDSGMALEPILQRPRLSVTTETTALGTLQAEAGLTWNPGQSIALPGTLRLGLSERTEAFAGGEGLRWDLDRQVAGPGNLTLGVRHRILDELEKSPALGFQMATKLPTASKTDQFGTSVIDWRFALMADKHFDGTLVSAFAQMGYLSEADGGGTDFEWTLATSMQQPIDERWSWFLEAAAVTSREQNREEGYVGAGMHLRLGRGDLVDFALYEGFGDTPNDWLLLLGYTRNLGAFYRLP